DGDTRLTQDRLALGARGGGGDQQVFAIHHVVDRRELRRAAPARDANDREPVLFEELLALFGAHLSSASSICLPSPTHGLGVMFTHTIAGGRCKRTSGSRRRI